MAEQTEKDTAVSIEKQVAQLVAKKLAEYGILEPGKETSDPKELPGYIKHGSARHASLLGLRKASSTDTIVQDGYTLVDTTAYGPQASESYIREVLRQLVNELQSGEPKMPPNAPDLWIPRIMI